MQMNRYLPFALCSEADPGSTGPALDKMRHSSGRRQHFRVLLKGRTLVAVRVPKETHGACVSASPANEQPNEKEMKEKEWKEEHKTKEAKTFTLALRGAACGPFLPGQHISFPATTSARPLFLSRRPISTPIGGIIKRKTEPSAGHIRKCAVGSKTESSNQQYLFFLHRGFQRQFGTKNKRKLPGRRSLRLSLIERKC